MIHREYELSANADLTVFEFTSTGKSGLVRIVIKYTPTLNKNVYNLGFGSIISDNTTTGEAEIDDISATGNSDIMTALATVFRSVYIFTEQYPEAYVLFGSSDPAKMRLYRMALSKNYAFLSGTFVLFGAVRDERNKLANMPYDRNADVDGYFIKRK
jgi:hypothetical protein